MWVRDLNAFFELFVVLAFAIGWAVLEYVASRHDAKREAERQHEVKDQPAAEIGDPKNRPPRSDT